jgi:hypothetical protein
VSVIPTVVPVLVEAAVKETEAVAEEAIIAKVVIFPTTKMS